LILNIFNRKIKFLTFIYCVGISIAIANKAAELITVIFLPYPTTANEKEIL